MEPNTPWLSSYGDVPFHLEYPDLSMSDLVLDTAAQHPTLTALSFMGNKTSYDEMAKQIEKTAKAFAALGIGEGNRVTLCLPNIPQTVYCLYALNRIGAVVSMIHPLSAEAEILFYLKEVESTYVVTLDQFFWKFEQVQKQYSIKKLIVTSVADALIPIQKTAYRITLGRKFSKISNSETVLSWKQFLDGGKNAPEKYILHKKGTDPAVILFSGGTTGVTKGILLSNRNFNALALQTIAMCYEPVFGGKMLAAMPMFHGFGLGVCVHTVLVAGAESILVPRFNVREYAKLVKKQRPNFIAGVPTLFEALTRDPSLNRANLNCLRGVFSGGDSLSVELKKKFDRFLDTHHSPVHIREGYGTTECVTASCLTPYHKEKEGSIGLPYPDTYYKICTPDTTQELPFGEEGEICLTGPSVMLGYLNHPEENAKTLRTHEDGRVWLHTGDLGKMDEEGFIYFRQRIKRMIISSGYNIYPSQIENILDAHPAVRMSCVIGVKDDYRMQKVKAFIVLKQGTEPSEETNRELLAYCKKRIAKYAMPYEIEFRESLPQTLVGKVAYTVLEKEEAEKESISV